MLWRNILNIYNFSIENDNDKEYKYKILVYPNITFQKDLEKDSYVVVLCNIIKEDDYEALINFLSSNNLGMLTKLIIETEKD